MRASVTIAVGETGSVFGRLRSRCRGHSVRGELKTAFGRATPSLTWHKERCRERRISPSQGAYMFITDAHGLPYALLEHEMDQMDEMKGVQPALAQRVINAPPFRHHSMAEQPMG